MKVTGTEITQTQSSKSGGGAAADGIDGSIVPSPSIGGQTVIICVAIGVSLSRIASIIPVFAFVPA